MTLRAAEPIASTETPITDGRVRVVVENVSPEIDDGRFAVKRIVGDLVAVEADVFADGHDEIAAALLYRYETEPEWSRSVMQRVSGDRWRGEFSVDRIGYYRYTVEGWIEPFETWRRDLLRRISAQQDTDIDYQIGAALVESAGLGDWAWNLRRETCAQTRRDLATSAELAALVRQHSARSFTGRYVRELSLIVDREKARFSTWYEVFPRSCASEVGRHGALHDCESWLPYISSMGFDVLYLPPIHPIGHTFRKGRDNSIGSSSDDVGSPWAIGAEEGGHTSIHPALGTLNDFDHLLARAADFGIEVALDIAFQCSPDHPYVIEHPEWFRRRPDGSIQYAENPPKKYQDIYPLDFETPQWRELWEELGRVVFFWIGRGVRIFRVDNPHTKAFAFWEWLIEQVKHRHPEVLFLAEAFTRPSVMYRLAKLGFSQSYTYFTWRNTKEELTQYFIELTQTPVREYFRPNLWPNTPDILPEYLQTGGRAAFMIRIILAGTLSGNYGIYGPAFEVCENAPREPGSEEYLNSEKYEIKRRELNAPESLKEFITRVNRIRRENTALQGGASLRSHQTDNPLVICYSQATADLSNIIFAIVNLDAFHIQRGWATLDLAGMGIEEGPSYQGHDLLGAGRYLWHGSRVYFELTPENLPAHIIRVRRWVRTEKQFDYYL